MNTTIEELKHKVDIVEFVGSYVPLKKAGRNYKGICPFHQEKTPSFIVSPERQLWRCFGTCGTGGDAIAFLMRLENLSFIEAVKDIAKRYGVSVQLSAETESEEETSLKERLIMANRAAAGFYHYLLTSSPIGAKAREYLEKRGINEKIIRTFELGYAPSSWTSLIQYLKKKGFSAGEAERAGLTSQTRRGPVDRFRGRLMFPLKDSREHIIGFSGRLIGPDQADTAKYVNTPETQIYHKRETLYGIHLTKDAIRKNDLAVIVEGEFDMITPFQFGIDNVVAIKGSACTQEQLLLLKRYTKRIHLALDSDAAGEEAVKRAIEVAEPLGFEIGVIQFEYAKDPDEAVRTDMVRFKRCIDSALPVYDFLFDIFTKKHPVSDPFSKKNIAEAMAPYLLMITNPIVYSHYIKKIAQSLDVSEKSVEETIAIFKKRRRIRFRGTAPHKEVPLSRSLVLERYLLGGLLQPEAEAQVISEVFNIIESGNLSQESHNMLFEAVRQYRGSHPQFEINTFVSQLPASISAVADELYLFFSSEKLNSSASLVHVAIEIRRNWLKQEMVTSAGADDEASSKKLHTLQAALKELEKRGSSRYN